MTRKGRRRLWLHVTVAAPVLTVALSMLCAWLLLRGSVGEERLEMLAAIVGGVCAFLLSLYTAIRVPRKKLLWGMITALGYSVALMLGNLLFFGEGYCDLGGVLLFVVGGGAVASLLGTLRHRKIA